MRVTAGGLHNTQNKRNDKVKIITENAKKQRKCSKCGRKILAGEGCVHISGGFGASSYSGNVCYPCLILMGNEYWKTKQLGGDTIDKDNGKG